MKKRVFNYLFALPALLLIIAWGFGFSPNYLYNAPSVATGIGARLACSMHFVLGQNEAQIAHDIKIYSPLLSLLDYQLDESAKTATASISFYQRTASYLPDVGCDLDYAGFSRQQYSWPASEQGVAELAKKSWPLGSKVDSLVPEHQQKLAAMLDKDNQLGYDTRALLVVHQGQIVAEAYAKGYSADSLFLGWSMSKSFTGLLAGQLAMQGKLNPAETHLFSQWQDQRQNISIAQLMQMTDGLAYDEIYEPGGSAPAMLFQAPDAVEYMLNLPQREAPGTFYRYSSGSTNLVMALIQERTASSARAAIASIAKSFYEPMGLAPVVFETDGVGLLMGSSYMYTTARNWAKLGQLMLNGGEINGVRLVSEDWVKESVQPNNAENRQDYGYFWWLNSSTTAPRWPSLPANVYAAMGSREQRVLIIPDQELIIVRLGWSPDKYRDNSNFAEISDWFKNDS